jgi:PAS domain-containing protein
MNKKPTYEELQKRVKLLEFQLNEQKKSNQDIDKETYYLDQAQKIGKLSTWEYNVENESIFWTPQNYKTFGVPIGTKITNELVLELVHPDDRASLIKNWQDTIKGKPYDVEHRLVVHGKIKWIRNKAKLIYNDKGDVVRLIGITQDPTRAQADRRQDPWPRRCG